MTSLPGLPGPFPAPSLAGFQAWVESAGGMGVPSDALLPIDPGGNDPLSWAYATAVYTVTPWLGQLPGPFYLQAVYNLGGDCLVNWQPDIEGVVWPNSATPAYPDGTPYWTYLRMKFGLFAFTPGVVSSSSDEGTSVSLETPANLNNLTIDQLQNLKTPWGRRYLALAQKTGTLWGLS